MKSVLRRLFMIPVFVWLVCAGAYAADPPHQANGPVPRDGVQVLDLQQVWQRGQAEDDLFFGSVNAVALGPDGNIYVLDQQQSQVFVFSAEGEEVRILSREGEGPGESRRPEHMVFLPDGSLGLVQYINGKIIRIDLEGLPLDSWMPPGYTPESGGMGSIRRARSRGGSFVVNGANVSPSEQGMLRTQYLVRCGEGTEIETEYLSRTTAAQLMVSGWIEKDHYFPSHDRWDIDQTGNLLAAADRNTYRVSVYDREGRVIRTFGREAKPWRRTEAEKQEMRDALTVIRDGQRVDVKVEVEDASPAISSLFVRPDGEIWVLPGDGDKEQPDGIMQTFDVFDPAGLFIRQVRIKCPGNPEEDRFILLDAHRAALLRGAVQARRNTFGGSRGDEGEVPVHDLILYTF